MRSKLFRHLVDKLLGLRALFLFLLHHKVAAVDLSEHAAGLFLEEHGSEREADEALHDKADGRQRAQRGHAGRVAGLPHDEGRHQAAGEGRRHGKRLRLADPRDVLAEEVDRDDDADDGRQRDHNDLPLALELTKIEERTDVNHDDKVDELIEIGNQCDVEKILRQNGPIAHDENDGNDQNRRDAGFGQRCNHIADPKRNGDEHQGALHCPCDSHDDCFPPKNELFFLSPGLLTARGIAKHFRYPPPAELEGGYPANVYGLL